MQSQPPTTAIRTEFLSALAEWSGRPIDTFPSDAPPCNALGTSPEDRTLAAVFAGVASINTPGMVVSRLERLHDLTGIHERYYAAALRADPEAVRELTAYRAMIEVIHSWFMAIYENAMQVSA